MSVFNEQKNCPKCRTSLLGDLIPEGLRDLYGRKHWRRETAIYSREDRTIAWVCPDCSHTWSAPNPQETER